MFEKIRHKLVELKIPAEQIKIKTAEINELKGCQPDEPRLRGAVRHYSQRAQRRLGLSFRLCLASLADKSSAVHVEQILGRVLRKPHVQQHGNDLLNVSYVFTASHRFMDTLQSVVKGLNRAGFSHHDHPTIDALEADASAQSSSAGQSLGSLVEQLSSEAPEAASVSM
ncbi:MAG: hypothetical protein ACRYGA_13445 [Janthinobacterium lividum]